MLNNLKVRSKLMVVLAVPLAALVAFTVVGAQDRLGEADNEARISRLTALVKADVELGHQLELERLWTGVNQASNGGIGTSQLAAQRAATNKAAEAFLNVPAGDVDGAAYADTVSAVSGIKALRDSIDNARSAPEIVASRFDSAATTLTRLIQTIGPQGKNVDFLQQMQVLAAVSSAKQSLSTLNLVIARAFISDGISPAERTAAQFQNEQFSEREDFLDQIAPEGIREAWANLRTAPEVRENTQFLRDFRQLAVIDIDPTQLVQSAASRLKATKTNIEDVVVAETERLAEAREDSARRSAQSFVLLATAAVISALLLAIVLSRSVVNPLRRLTRSTYELSEERLPQLLDQLTKPDVDLSALKLEPIEIRSRDEIGQLAVAFNALQDVTMNVAHQQSQLLRKGIGDIFVNLARRNQSLLDRQIEFIDQLEANEEDPDQLENLFKLDHLATRMRRNAESLLVLAGAEPPRRRGRPVDIADVVRVAIGEVEQFSRITLLALDGAAVAGNVAVDLAHLLSELMENATQFSPPDTQVEIVGHLTRDGNYVISVSDQGIGMSADQLNEANRVMASPPMLGLALSRSLGFTVIGRLAQRFGIIVRLAASPAGGVSALVTVPAGSVTAAPELGSSISPVAPAAPPLPARAPASGSAFADVPAVPAVPAVDLSEGGAPAPAVAPDATPAYEPFDFGALMRRPETPSAPPPDAPLRAESPAAPTVPRPLAPPASAPAPPTPAAPMVPAATAANTPPSAPPLASRSGNSNIPSEGPSLAEQEGLRRRTPKQVERPTDAGGRPISTTATPSGRSPEEVRKMLSRYRSGLKSHTNEEPSGTTERPAGG